jgi:hypothetical protein
LDKICGENMGRFMVEHDSLWKQVIVTKYGYEIGSWSLGTVNGPYGMSLWKHIRQGWDRFSPHIKFVLGCGSCIRFWLDIWCGEDTLSGAFPLLLRIAQSSEAWVADTCVGRMGFLTGMSVLLGCYMIGRWNLSRP